MVLAINDLFNRSTIVAHHNENGNTVGTNRPDASGIDPNTGKRVNVEIDTDPKRSKEHQKVVPKNDPNAKNIFIVIDPVTGKEISRVVK